MAPVCQFCSCATNHKHNPPWNLSWGKCNPLGLQLPWPTKPVVKNAGGCSPDVEKPHRCPFLLWNQTGKRRQVLRHTVLSTTGSLNPRGAKPTHGTFVALVTANQIQRFPEAKHTNRLPRGPTGMKTRCMFPLYHFLKLLFCCCCPNFAIWQQTWLAPVGWSSRNRQGGSTHLPTWRRWYLSYTHVYLLGRKQGVLPPLVSWGTPIVRHCMEKPCLFFQ